MTTRRIINGPDELKALIGTEIGVSQWHRVTQDQICLFANATGDHQWIHVEPLRAREGPYGGTIAHGYLTLALIPFLAKQAFSIENVQMVINYGLDRARFPTPVKVGAFVRLHTKLISVKERPEAIHAYYDDSIEIQGLLRPACAVKRISRIVT